MVLLTSLSSAARNNISQGGFCTNLRFILGQCHSSCTYCKCAPAAHLLDNPGGQLEAANLRGTVLPF